MASTFFAYTLGASQAEAEYYRGMYDTCVFQTRQPQFCLALMTKFQQHHWYETESPGWQWPLPTTEGQTGRGYPNQQRMG